MAVKIGIDLGTSTTKICTKQGGIVLREPTAIAFDTRTGELIGAGARAKKMLGKTPPEKEVVLPMRGGVISDFEDTVGMLTSFLYKLKLKDIFKKPAVAVSIPWGITEVEHNAFENVCIEAGGRDIYLAVSEPMAAAIGAGVDIKKARGKLICDIGGGNTQTAVISARGVVSAGMERVGGDDFDAAIITYVKEAYSIIIGRQTAENLKKTSGCAHPAFEREPAEFYGRNLLTGQVVSVKISSAELREAITPELDRIIEHIKATLETIPAELSADVFEAGPVLCGGCALLPGLDRFVSDRVGMRVQTAKHSSDCVCAGLCEILRDDDYNPIVAVKEEYV